MRVPSEGPHLFDHPLEVALFDGLALVNPLVKDGDDGDPRVAGEHQAVEEGVGPAGGEGGAVGGEAGADPRSGLELRQGWGSEELHRLG